MSSTTIRVSAETRDDLNLLCASSGKSAGAVVAELVAEAKLQTLLYATERHWHSIGETPEQLADYINEARELQGFDAEPEEY